MNWNGYNNFTAFLEALLLIQKTDINDKDFREMVVDACENKMKTLEETYPDYHEK